jgi:SAM-dependent methyltransferase
MDPWLSASWSFVRDQLPAAPATVLEIGCGPRGGFVPELVRGGYHATGVDPDAPDGPEYERVRFEEYTAPQSCDVVIACTSLHHVDDLDEVIDRIAEVVVSDGVVIVIEWVWERFDEATAWWCFERLAPTPPDEEATWLHRHREGWIESGRSWDGYFTSWVGEHGLHAAARIVGALDRRFECRLLRDSPYFFSDLDTTSAADEQVAIDAGTIQPNGLRYVGSSRLGGE